MFYISSLSYPNVNFKKLYSEKNNLIQNYWTWIILLQWFTETTELFIAWNIEILIIILKVMNFLLIIVMDWIEDIFFVL